MLRKCSNMHGWPTSFFFFSRVCTVICLSQKLDLWWLKLILWRQEERGFASKIRTVVPRRSPSYGRYKHSGNTKGELSRNLVFDEGLDAAKRFDPQSNNFFFFLQDSCVFVSKCWSNRRSNRRTDFMDEFPHKKKREGLPDWPLLVWHYIHIVIFRMAS